MGELDIVSGPRAEHRGEVPTLGIREAVPLSTMLANRDRLLAELIGWLADQGIEPAGHFFLRLHVVNMSDLMDIEAGVSGVTESGDGRVQAGSFPADDYAVLAYRAKSMAANRRLHDWVSEQGWRSTHIRIRWGKPSRLDASSI